MAEPVKRAPAPDEIDDLDDDPFHVGWRWQWISLPDGTRTKREIPLTVEDLLDPQVGDQAVQNNWHVEIAHVLLDMLKWRYAAHPDVFIGSDLKILWGIPGLENPAPDVVVIPGVRNRDKYRRSFSVRRERALPALCIEVVSDDPKQRDNDYKAKVRIYQQAGVREYLILDPAYHTGDPFWAGYRLDPGGRYRPIAPDAEGRIFSETTGLWFGIDPDGRSLRIVDAITGERLKTSEEARQAAQDAEAELARLREEIRRLKDSMPR
ncbi:MAG TPA: Uma2 family endonuclease [Thermoanaerobaculia bacterium]|nr:Uma2 family endonuclease [Thermoanaerobaculia bacterium]